MFAPWKVSDGYTVSLNDVLDGQGAFTNLGELGEYQRSKGEASLVRRKRLPSLEANLSSNTARTSHPAQGRHRSSLGVDMPPRSGWTCHLAQALTIHPAVLVISCHLPCILLCFYIYSSTFFSGTRRVMSICKVIICL